MSGKSSMCMMCLKYRIILLIDIKNPWAILLAYVLFTAPLIPPAGLLATFGGFDIPTFKISLSFLIAAWQLCIYRFAI